MRGRGVRSLARGGYEANAPEFILERIVCARFIEEVVAAARPVAVQERYRRQESFLSAYRLDPTSPPVQGKKLRHCIRPAIRPDRLLAGALRSEAGDGAHWPEAAVTGLAIQHCRDRKAVLQDRRRTRQQSEIWCRSRGEGRDRWLPMALRVGVAPTRSKSASAGLPLASLASSVLSSRTRCTFLPRKGAL